MSHQDSGPSKDRMRPYEKQSKIIPEREQRDNSKNLDISSTENNRNNFQADRYEGGNATLVTALYDIGRDKWKTFNRNMKSYLKYFEQVLDLDMPMTIFVDKSLTNFVTENRKDKLCKTKIYQRTFGELPLSKYASDIAEVLRSKAFLANNKMLRHPEAFSKNYLITTNSKPSMVRQVANDNPFQTTQLFWLDGGYGHGNNIYPENDGKWKPNNLLTPKLNGHITYITLKDMHVHLGENDMLDLHKRQVNPIFNGGFFGGTADVVIEFAKLFNEEFRKGLLNSVVDDDQGTVLRTYLEHPEMFNLVIGDWYDVFKLFH